MIVTFNLPIKVISEANCRDHWAKKMKRVKTQRSTAFWMCPKFSVPCIVTLTRIGKRTLDSDNLAGAFKGVRDGIADRIGIDDGSPLIEWRYAQEKGEYGVRVELCPAE